jgi:hypothetical protein
VAATSDGVKAAMLAALASQAQAVAATLTAGPNAAVSGLRMGRMGRAAPHAA